MQLFRAGSVSDPMSKPAPSRFIALISACVWLALVAGCSSDPRPENRDASVAVPDYPPVMAGTENFGDGTLVVQVTLGLPSSFRPGDKEGQRAGGSHSGHRSGNRHGGGMGAGGPPSGTESGEGPSEGSPEAGPRLTGSTLPPAQIKLHLQNKSATDAVNCEVVDFNSALGNFAVFPDRYQLAAGQSAISETMTSRLGVEGAEIPVTVALRVRDHVERKVITLRLLPAPAKPAASAP